MPTLRTFCLLALLLLTASALSVAAAPAPTVEVTFAPSLRSPPITGRLYVFLSERQSGEPMRGPNWFAPEPFFRVEVENFAPGETCVIGDAAAAFPAPLSELRPGEYRAQAVLDHDFYAHHPANGAGNLYSDVVTWSVGEHGAAPLRLTLTNTIAAAEFNDTVHVREVRLLSRLLSDFHGHDVYEFAGIVLPPSYEDEPDRYYPTIYEIPGFGGDHRRALRYARRGFTGDDDGVEFIRVMLSGNCKWGHHVYADSATNGPRGAALVEEMIPHIEREFRAIPRPTARLVTGHSSGGWSSLWLQVRYPDVFGGVWSTAPDPVDFRDFQRINIYASPPDNVFLEADGSPRPLARRGETPVVWYEQFSNMDDVLGRGGQLRSFEAVFSPLDDDGLPRRLWDRTTGQIDPQVAEPWQAYDVSLLLAENWPQLREKLAGKLHIFTGTLDTFYLEGAVLLLAEELAALGSDAQITIVEGADHSSLMTQELRQQIRREMVETVLRHHGAPAAQTRPRAPRRPTVQAVDARRAVPR